MLDYYLDLADSTDGEKVEHQSRWNCDGSFWLWTYEKNRTAAQFNRLINRIKDGHISVPLNALVVCLGGAPAEAIIRGMYYPGKIEREYGIKFNMAIAMENQTFSYGLTSLWSGAGARFSWKGICGCDTKVQDFNDRVNEIYWCEGPAHSKILMKWNSLFQQNTGIGGYAEARYPDKVVDFVSTDPNFIQKYPYNIIGAFGKGWDDLQTLTNEFVSVAKEKTDTNKTVIVSNEEDFFSDFDSTYGKEIPTVSCSYGNEWDLYCASLAEESSRVKRAVEKMRGAEAISAIVNSKNPGFYNLLENERENVWMDLGLYWEHNFGMVNRTGQIVQERIDWQKRLASEIENYVETLYSNASAELSKMIIKNGNNQRFYVFNPLSWERTDFADLLYSGSEQIHVIDITTGEEVPSQIININNQTFLRILASNIPSMGYKVFEIQDGTGTLFTNAGSMNGNKIDNDFYTIVFNGNGSIKSLIDKSTGKEYAQEINGKYLNDLGTGSGTVELENDGPVSITVKATTQLPISHTTSITLYKEINRIDIKNEITQNFSDTYAWNFGFNLSNPDIWHEEVGAIVKAKLKSHGGIYSDRNARYDWLTINHFADISDGSGGVTISNPDCYFMKIGNSTTNFLDESTPSISILAGGKVGGHGGLPDQGGDSYFLQRFALQTHSKYDPATAMRFALEHQNPFVTSFITGGNQLPESGFSFLSIDNPNVFLWAMKPAEDKSVGDLIMRLWNMSDLDEDFSIIFENSVVSNVRKTSLIEVPVENINASGNKIDLKIPGNQIQTYSFNNTVTSVLSDHINFQAEIKNNNVTLNWSTAKGNNIKGFEIYRNNQYISFIAAKAFTSKTIMYSYRDSGLANGKYEYKLAAVDYSGLKKDIEQIEIEISSDINGYLLLQNYPNPFNPQTIIKFNLAQDGQVSIILFNVLGEKVRTILNKNMSKGFHEIKFEAKGVSAGVYFYTMKAGRFSATKKLVIVN